MIALYFDPSKFPRTITRAEWRDIWRWKRETQKRIAQEIVDRQNDLIFFGTVMLPAQRKEIIERLVNPPLLVHSKMETP